MRTNYLHLLFFLLGTCFTATLHAQSLLGAWERNYESAEGASLVDVIIFTEGYQVLSTYNKTTGAFIDTNGGQWSIDSDTVTEVVAFHAKNPESVGKKVSFKVTFSKDVLTIPALGNSYKRVDSGRPGKLQGAWLMSGRIREGKTQSRDTSRPRKTMKILSGTRFQWIAYNTETKQFMGTGGGTYTTIDGQYTENIEFFSKDNSRVGASLQFTYDLKNKDWHHSGLSSKGTPIYEIWSLRK